MSAKSEHKLLSTFMSVPSTADPATLYFSLRNGKPSFLLESADGPGESARYSVIGCDPLVYIRIDENGVHITGTPFESGKGGSLEILKKCMGFDQRVSTLLPRYALACFGYISYDYVRELVKLDDLALNDLHHPTIEFMLPSNIIVMDQINGVTHYCHLDFVDRAEDGKGMEEIRRMMCLAQNPRAYEIKQTRPSIKSNLSRSQFEHIVEQAKEYIVNGDIIQVVLSRRIELTPAPDPLSFYLELRRINPSPYMFFFDFPDRQVIGSSPEILVRVDGRKVITRPIAGTRRRSRGRMDERMERDLLRDEKERAEHVMLVDLGRNDIGKVSEFGSVEVTEFMKVEKYSHVQHLVSNVTGKLRDGEDAFSALNAVFPAGTVSGAPKIRAMEIIEELEPVRRGIYAGAVGSFSYTGDADFAITIRTMIIEKRSNTGYLQVGAGIVADSVPWKEYYETENKARALLKASGVG